jgi:hypothetical protein
LYFSDHNMIASASAGSVMCDGYPFWHFSSRAKVSSLSLICRLFFIDTICLVMHHIVNMKKGRPFGRKSFKTEEERQVAFWERVQIGGLDQCWNWTGYREKQTGYGKVFFEKRLNSAHRYAYIVSRGPIPTGMLVCHRCDNRLCQNPTHLFVGTIADNNRDMFAKGRGSKPPSSAKSTPELVYKIRAMYIPYKMSMSKIANQLGIPMKRVECALRCWKYL